VSVIGPLSLDHTDVLGADVLSIAREKCGIIKPGQVVISAAQPEDVAHVLRVTCEAHSVPLTVCGQAFSASVLSHDLVGLTLDIRSLRATYPGITLPLVGRHQAENAAAAVAALEALGDTGAPHSLVERGLSRVSWPGRIEVSNESPLVVLDGAHNPQAAQALVQTLRELLPRRRIHMLLGMSADKDSHTVARILGPLAASITCTRSRHPRALDPALLAERVKPYCQEVHEIADYADASTYLLNAIEPDEVLLITGSLFLVGALRSSFTQARTRRVTVAA
jgi:dihydrofolate synthase/folylpolyglutamate synthase